MMIYIEDNAKKAWDLLTNLYSQSGYTSKSSLFTEFQQSSLKSCDNSIERFIQKIKRISTKLAVHGAGLYNSQIAN
jgi:gag-polypeptide of LTR copia-type